MSDMCSSKGVESFPKTEPIARHVVNAASDKMPDMCSKGKLIEAKCMGHHSRSCSSSSTSAGGPGGGAFAGWGSWSGSAKRGLTLREGGFSSSWMSSLTSAAHRVTWCTISFRNLTFVRQELRDLMTLSPNHLMWARRWISASLSTTDAETTSWTYAALLSIRSAAWAMSCDEALTIASGVVCPRPAVSSAVSCNS